MVRLFGCENYGKCCWKILRHDDSRSSKVLLYADEGWTGNLANIYWVLKRPWWSNTKCRVTEYCGSRQYTTRAKITDLGKGVLCIKGKFKHYGNEPDFRLSLTSNVSMNDFRLGYTMAGILERGDKKQSHSLHMTHFAMMTKKET